MGSAFGVVADEQMRKLVAVTQRYAVPEVVELGVGELRPEDIVERGA